MAKFTSLVRATDNFHLVTVLVKVGHQDMAHEIQCHSMRPPSVGRGVGIGGGGRGGAVTWESFCTA